MGPQDLHIAGARAVQQHAARPKVGGDLMDSAIGHAEYDEAVAIGLSAPRDVAHVDASLAKEERQAPP